MADQGSSGAWGAEPSVPARYEVDAFLESVDAVMDAVERPSARYAMPRVFMCMRFVIVSNNSGCRTV